MCLPEAPVWEGDSPALEGPVWGRGSQSYPKNSSQMPKPAARDAAALPHQPGKGLSEILLLLPLGLISEALWWPLAATAARRRRQGQLSQDVGEGAASQDTASFLSLSDTGEEGPFPGRGGGVVLPKGLAWDGASLPFPDCHLVWISAPSDQSLRTPLGLRTLVSLKGELVWTELSGEVCNLPGAPLTCAALLLWSSEGAGVDWRLLERH